MDKFFLDRIYNIFFPIKCGYCGKITGNVSYVCDECNKLINTFDERCKYCGKKIFREDRVCKECRKKKIYYDDYIFFDEYNGNMRELMIKYKFNDAKYLGDFFAQELSKMLYKINVDFVTGVPISQKRFNERGYNQTDLIAKKISRLLNINYLENLLIKVKETPRQSKLSREERKNNVKNSFELTDIYNIRNRNILLIDDIFTTGATVNECSKVIKMAKANRVVVATILKRNLA